MSYNLFTVTLVSVPLISVLFAWAIIHLAGGHKKLGTTGTIAVVVLVGGWFAFLLLAPEDYGYRFEHGLLAMPTALFQVGAMFMAGGVVVRQSC